MQLVDTHNFLQIKNVNLSSTMFYGRSLSTIKDSLRGLDSILRSIKHQWKNASLKVHIEKYRGFSIAQSIKMLIWDFYTDTV